MKRRGDIAVMILATVTGFFLAGKLVMALIVYNLVTRGELFPEPSNNAVFRAAPGVACLASALLVIGVARDWRSRALIGLTAIIARAWTVAFWWSGFGPFNSRH